MKLSRVPHWSFLAVEPFVVEARKRIPEPFATVVSPVAAAAARKIAFLKILEWVEACLRLNGIPAPSRRMLAMQVFYALVDVSDVRTIPDRDLERWQNQVFTGLFAETPTHAVIQGQVVVA